MHLLVLHGPNLDLLGRREPQLYGNESLEEVDRSLRSLAEELGATVECWQSPHEGELIERIHATEAVGILINPGGLGHSSVALRDALRAHGRPMVEVHCSNLARREEFRHHTLLSDIAVGTVMGFGGESYRLGLRALWAHLSRIDA